MNAIDEIYDRFFSSDDRPKERPWGPVTIMDANFKVIRIIENPTLQPLQFKGARPSHLHRGKANG